MRYAVLLLAMILAVGCCSTIKEPTPEPQVVYVPVPAKIPAPPEIVEPSLVVPIADWNPDWKAQDFLMIIMQDYAELYRWYQESLKVINEYKVLSSK